MVPEAMAQVSHLSGSSQPLSGSVVYSLPRTAIKLKVEVVKESYVEGPYASYAQKYLSINVPRRAASSYTIESISMMPVQESDPSQAFMLNIGSTKNASANFLAFSSEGLILPIGYQSGDFGQARFSNPPADVMSFFDMNSEPNFVNESAVFYNTVKTDTGFVRVPVERAQLVEKNTEKKAEEVANTIFNLRKKRIELITGEADNIPSGDGLRAALEEIQRLEEEYLSLFIGKTYSGMETCYFDVIPAAGQNKQSYIAFRFSETQGVLPSGNVAGRPIILELQSEKNAQSVDTGGASKTAQIFYRVPQIVQALLMDGQKVLIQDRIPVLQLGQTLSIPADALMR
jgi:hypothetical protein